MIFADLTLGESVSGLIYLGSFVTEGSLVLSDPTATVGALDEQTYVEHAAPGIWNCIAQMHNDELIAIAAIAESFAEVAQVEGYQYLDENLQEALLVTEGMAGIFDSGHYRADITSEHYNHYREDPYWNLQFNFEEEPWDLANRMNTSEHPYAGIVSDGDIPVGVSGLSGNGYHGATLLYNKELAIAVFIQFLYPEEVGDPEGLDLRQHVLQLLYPDFLRPAA